jgi:hypothetical protein
MKVENRTSKLEYKYGDVGCGELELFVKSNNNDYRSNSAQ